MSAVVVQTSAAETSIYASLKGDLVQADGKKVKRFDETALAQTKYYAIYYSAEWCPPCRAFTPKLVNWYKEKKPNNPHFELIFVSSDQSEDAMAKYMKDDGMPWPALDFDKKRTNKTLTQYAGNGIPCLVLVDDQGKVLSHSYEGSKYVGPTKVLADIDKTLAENPASGDAKAAASTAAKPKVGSSSFDEAFKKKPAGQ